MIVLVESNFVLELAFQQEEAPEAEQIVELAEAKSIELVVPAYSLGEPYETLIRRRKGRESVLARLRQELDQLARSRDYADLPETSRRVTEALAASADSQATRLDHAARRLLACARVLALSGETISRALQVQVQFALGPQDAIVFASIEEYVKNNLARPTLFINKNHRDFLTPDIQAHFEESGCKLLPRIRTAVEFILRNALGAA